jgi:hypothetical protein
MRRVAEIELERGGVFAHDAVDRVGVPYSGASSVRL